ncbi:MAG: 30S ribosomal protein S10 [Candidatus Dojkabacteria bacterium]|nr:30S ribosomal protein S10 [Candidatus Dojkabacteria bacterium]
MQKIRIKIKGYDYKVVEKAVKQIIDAVVETGASIRGPIPLPSRKWKIAVHRSPHIDAKSKEHFGIIESIRLVDILDPNAKTIETITKLQIPSGVEVTIK